MREILNCLCRSVEAAQRAPMLLKAAHIEEAALHQVALLSVMLEKIESLEERIGEFEKERF